MQYTHTYILNIRITVGDDYDRGCVKNTFTALFITDQQHVLACGTKLLMYWHAVQNSCCTGMRYITPIVPACGTVPPTEQ